MARGKECWDQLRALVAIENDPDRLYADITDLLTPLRKPDSISYFQFSSLLTFGPIVGGEDCERSPR